MSPERLRLADSCEAIVRDLASISHERLPEGTRVVDMPGVILNFFEREIVPLMERAQRVSQPRRPK